MQCGIQLGHGMRSYTEELVSAWGHAMVMLGPRNFDSRGMNAPDKLVAFSKTISKNGACTFVDPQLFSCKAPQKHLASFPHCSACQQDLSQHYREVVKELATLNAAACTQALILPSNTTDVVDDKWRTLQESMVSAAAEFTDQDVYITVALTSSALRTEASINTIANLAEKLPIKGVYLVCEHPRGDYLTNDALWLLNLMLMAAAIRLSGKEVFVGYASHQQLSLVVSKCTAIFSGTYLNMRHFATENFEADDSSGPNKHVRWYYAPNLLSEYRTVTLDIAKQRGMLDAMRTPFKESRYAELLFSGDMPSGTAYKDRDSFLHYLDSLHKQCSFFSRQTFQDSFDAYLSFLQTAGRAVEGLHREGIYDRRRSYLDALDASESAVLAFGSEMGFQMSMSWDELH